MNDNITVMPQTKNFRFSAVTVAVIVTVFSIAVWMGCRIPPVGSGGAVTVSSPFEDGFISGAVRLCMWDVVPLAVFAFFEGAIVRLIFSGAVFFFKGAALGAAVVFCIENSANASLLGILLSYCAVSLLTAIFCIITSYRKELGFGIRTLMYFTVCGAVSLLRIVPYLLL